MRVYTDDGGGVGGGGSGVGGDGGDYACGRNYGVRGAGVAGDVYGCDGCGCCDVQSHSGRWNPGESRVGTAMLLEREMR